MVLRPLSYESLKVVLQNMDPNTRFQVAYRCPTIRRTERVVPLRIDTLQFTNGVVKINNTNYKIGIVRKYVGMVTPDTVREQNERGGVSYEVDEFGFEDRVDETTLTAGDVYIHAHVREDVDNTTTEEKIVELKEFIRELEDELSTDRRRETINDFDADELEELESSYIKLLGRQYQLENAFPPYRHYLQLTIENHTGETTIERYLNNKKFSQAMKQLGEYFFGGNRGLVTVKHFQILNFKEFVLRLPLGVKFRVEELDLIPSHGMTLDSLQSIIDRSSYPLKNLCIGLREHEDIDRPDVRNAQVLKLNETSDLQLLTSISNKVVYVQYNELNIDDLMDLVEHWITTNREVGTEFTFSVEEEFVEEMESMRNLFNGEFREERVLILPMTALSRLIIDFRQTEIYDKSLYRLLKLSIIAIM